MLVIPSLNSPFISPYCTVDKKYRYCPCFPALYRAYRDSPDVKRPEELPSKKRDAYLLEQVRLMAFLLVLERHPAIAHARDIGLRILQPERRRRVALPLCACNAISPTRILLPLCCILSVLFFFFHILKGAPVG